MSTNDVPKASEDEVKGVNFAEAAKTTTYLGQIEMSAVLFNSARARGEGEGSKRRIYGWAISRVVSSGRPAGCGRTTFEAAKRGRCERADEVRICLLS